MSYYSLFHLPEDFLHRPYTKAEKDHFDKKIMQAVIKSRGIQEELSPKQKEEVDEMPDTDYIVDRLHHGVFGKGVERMEIPYEHDPDEFKHVYTGCRRAVENHLKEHGYEPTNYIEGRCRKIDGSDKREFKIGSILAANNPDSTTHTSRYRYGNGNTMTQPDYLRKEGEDGRRRRVTDEYGEFIVTKPPTLMTVKQAFDNDPIRGAAKSPSKIIVTRNRYDVCGMSTDRGWRSCMHMENGENNHYLPYDMHHGTLTAYIVKKDDDNITKPIGRTNLKRYVGNEGEHDNIFRTDGSTYGVVTPKHLEAIHKWAEEKYPFGRSFAYKQHEDLYDDGADVHFNPNSAPSLHSKKAEELHGELHRHLTNYARFFMNDDQEHDYDDIYGTVYSHAKKIIKSWVDQNPEEHSKLLNHVYHYNAYNMRDEQHRGDYSDFSEDAIHEVADHHRSGDKDLTHEELSKYLNKHQNNRVDSTHFRYDEQNHFKVEAHHELINHALLHGTDEHKTQVVNHILDDTEYHGNVADVSYRGSTPHANFDQHITNPRLLHRIAREEGFEGGHEDLRSDSKFIKHAVKHADEKLLQHLTFEHPDKDDFDHHLTIAGALNDHPDGERLQHHLTSGMHFEGAHTAKYYRSLYYQSSGLQQHYDEDITPHHLIADALASKTKFKSVAEKLATRSDYEGTSTQQRARDNLNAMAIKESTHENQPDETDIHADEDAVNKRRKLANYVFNDDQIIVEGILLEIGLLEEKKTKSKKKVLQKDTTKDKSKVELSGKKEKIVIHPRL